jgi:hypothetical protein
MDPVRERRIDERPRVSVAAAQRVLGQLERHDRMHQALVCAVVQVTHRRPRPTASPGLALPIRPGEDGEKEQP